jgi:hypothetical protein
LLVFPIAVVGIPHQQQSIERLINNSHKYMFTTLLVVGEEDQTMAFNPLFLSFFASFYPIYPLLVKQILSKTSKSTLFKAFITRNNAIVASDNALVTRNNAHIASNNGFVVTNNAIVAYDNAFVARNNGLVAYDNAVVARDNGLVARDK